MTTQPLGELVWISVRPMLRLAMCIGSGYILTKCDRLPPIAARGAGQIILNIALPSLFFSKIVPTFDSKNISSIAPLLLMCVLYQTIGLLTSLVVSAVFWVPHRFRWGIIVAGIWGNYGDLPTAIIMSVTAVAPFQAADQDLAIAYIAAFVFMFMVTLFPMGGHYLVARDFYGPDKDDREVQIPFREKTKKFARWLLHFPRLLGTSAKRDVESIVARTISKKNPDENMYSRDVVERSNESSHRKDVHDSELGGITPVGPMSVQDFEGSQQGKETTLIDQEHKQFPRAKRRQTRLLSRILHVLQVIFTIPTTIILSGFIISVIPALKGLFVLLPSSPKAPDGQPPLAFILDTATFLGEASVPLGLIGLGSALARLHVPRNQWKQLPVGSILGLAVGRMVLQPVLGILIVKGLTFAGIIDKDNKVLQFVAIFFSCVPTATTQIFLTQAYSAPESVEHLPAYLVPQYVLMFISCTILTAYTLHLLFA
ncbi:hypothetical protein M422DRAFT_265058 [Sphaerobolus stellatus SS14]|uniref:Auxin efflux carrier n=1 Tax=Sphaerobolus stellatus (strain SS14) TaxID=990650 RepID=A0A0C9V6D1_SPHS4|nr:hypothetical protein M422DRAFT_265058 [Sphaerobolus stellatus SS14]